ncbi:hypothetical protein CF327_g6917 [Tilletia walkeri]|nr:hypothetical protein CF327_g6917 [Tilletia walkeri]
MTGLAALALDVFSAPSTSVNVERLFSQAGHHVTPLRHRMKAIKVGQLVTVGAWFRDNWVPANLLSQYLHQQKQNKLKEKARKRSAEEGLGDESTSKRARTSNSGVISTVANA